MKRIEGKILLKMLSVLVVGVVLGNPGRAIAAQVMEVIPPNGSITVGPCGPFGVVLDTPLGGGAGDYTGAIQLRGSITGLRKKGIMEVHGDTLLFTPYVPMAPGEKVEVMVRKNLGGGISLNNNYVWTCRIKAQLLALPYESEFSLDRFSYGEGLEFVDWDWGDLDGDLIADAVLLVEDAERRYHVITVKHLPLGYAPELDFLPMEKADDNAVALDIVDLDADRKMDVVVVTLTDMFVYSEPGVGSSPKLAKADKYSLGGMLGADLATGDLDGDGDEDIIVIGYFATSLKVFLNNGKGSFTPILTNSQSSKKIVGDWQQGGGNGKIVPYEIGDVDNDGMLDMVLGSDFEVAWRRPVKFFKGIGDGSFGSPCKVADLGPYPQGIFAAKAFSMGTNAAPEMLLPITSGNSSRRWLYAYRKTGSCSFAVSDSVALPSLTSAVGECALSNFFVDDYQLFESSTPELLYCDPDSGFLFLREINSMLGERVLIAEEGVDRVVGGDLDLDLDGDIAMVNPNSSTIILMSKYGGIAIGQPPSFQNYSDGDTIDFFDKYGPAEAKCPSDSQVILLVVNNLGAKPVAVKDSIIWDPCGAFSLGEYDTSFFSGACAGGGIGIMEIPIIFKAPDTVTCIGQLQADLTWMGGGDSGSDITYSYTFFLKGVGGIYEGGIDGRDFLRLRWTPNGGYSDYSLDVDSINFGEIPKPKQFTGCQIASRELTFENTGDLKFVVAAPSSTLVSHPFTLKRINPPPTGSDTLHLDPGDIAKWNLSVNPESVTTGGQYSLQLPWVVEEVSYDYRRCLNSRMATQNVTVTLKDVDPCFRPIYECQGTPDSCFSQLAVYPCCGDITWKLCLQLSEWNWYNANPVVSVYKTLPWVGWDYDADTQEVTLFAESPVTCDSGYVTIQAKDSSYACVSTSITINVYPNAPIAFVKMESDSGWAATISCDCDKVTQLPEIAMCLEEGDTGIASFTLDSDPMDQVNMKYMQMPSYCIDTLNVDWALDPLDPQLAWLTVYAPPGIGSCGGDCEHTLLLIAEDLTCHVADTIKASIRVIPELPDLKIDSVECIAQGSGVLRSVEPFNIEVTVSVSKISADSVIVKLSGDSCSCTISPDSVIIDYLAQGDTAVVTFSVLACDIGSGIDCSIPIDCPFQATVFSIRGSDYDSNTENNRKTHRCPIYPDCEPDIVFSNLKLTPSEQNLTKCESGTPSCNDYIRDNPSFCLIEGTTLEVDVSCVDTDGDSVWLEITNLPAWAGTHRVDNANIHLTLHPDSGLSEGECCRLFQDAIKFVGTEEHGNPYLPKVQKAESSDVHVKCDCPDLESEITAPRDRDIVHINDIINIEGCIHAYDSDAENIMVTVTVDLNGSPELIETTTIPSLKKDQTICIGDLDLFPDGIEYVPEHSGRLCVNLVTSGPTDCDPINNKSTVCLSVEPGPFIVRPNVITPNNDQKNDFAYFHFNNQDLASPVVKIFSLSGRLVFVSLKMDQEERIAWNGRNQSGKLVSPGAYIYVVYDGGKKFKSGEIGVVR